MLLNTCCCHYGPSLHSLRRRDCALQVTRDAPTDLWLSVQLCLGVGIIVQDIVQGEMTGLQGDGFLFHCGAGEESMAEAQNYASEEYIEVRFILQTCRSAMRQILCVFV